MDIQRKGAGKRKVIRWTVTVVVLVVVGVGITIGLGKLKPAAPGVEMSTLWPDQVKRGPMLRDNGTEPSDGFQVPGDAI